MIFLLAHLGYTPGRKKLAPGTDPRTSLGLVVPPRFAWPLRAEPCAPLTRCCSITGASGELYWPVRFSSRISGAANARCPASGLHQRAFAKNARARLSAL